MKENISIAEKTVVVILAGGKGSRMDRANMTKVCFGIDGVPAIIRTITTFKKNGFKKFLVVVGARAQDVMETVAAVHSGVSFVFQKQQLGTGHAARIANESLKNMGHDGPILVTLGDKFLESEAVELLLDGFVRKRADFSILTIPKNKDTEGSGARVLLDKTGQATAIIERVDLARQEIVDKLNSMVNDSTVITGEKLKDIIDGYLPSEKKQKIAVPELLELAANGGRVNKAKLKKIIAQDNYHITVDGQRYTAKEVDKNCGGINPSLFLSKSEAFYKGVGMLDNNNAQHEYYLTAIVSLLAGCSDGEGRKQYRVRAVAADRCDLIQGFNSPDELITIQDYLRRKKADGDSDATAKPKVKLKASQYCSVSKWIEKIKADRASLKRWLKKTYGDHARLHTEKQKALLEVLQCYGKKFGFDKEVVIVRAPGRVNLMGRHVDSIGGYNNFLAIDKETIAVAGLRDDDNVTAVNTNPKKFKAQQFNMSELIGEFAWSEWENFVQSDWVRNHLRTTEGTWGNYIKAAMLRLQHEYSDLKIQGLNIALSGNVPIAAGLSSSSTIVVAVLQAAIALNRLELTSQQLIDLCGEGEWFVGSRGGKAEHAAIYLGQKGKVANVGYLPFNVEKIINAPKDYQVLIANSHIKAANSSEAKQTFNAKMNCYTIGFELLKFRCPHIGNSAEFLRDINPQSLGCTISDIYRYMKKIPHSVTQKDIKSVLPGRYKELVDLNLLEQNRSRRYNLRGVLMFGIAEIMRSKLCVDYLESNRIEEFGEFMKISHNGERVGTPGNNGGYKPYEVDYTDDHLNKLINDLGSEDPVRVLNAQLYRQPGAYGCSTKEIDRMVDIACSVDGVAGAQIAGAGLGGCIMIMSEKNAVKDVKKALADNYYKPKKLESAVSACRAVEGAGLAEF